MKKVKRVNLSNLHNEEHFQFISAILTVLNGAQASIRTYLMPLIATLAELCDREHSALRKQIYINSND
jgi:hypothetical protein